MHSPSPTVGGFGLRATSMMCQTGYFWLENCSAGLDAIHFAYSSEVKSLRDISSMYGPAGEYNRADVNDLGRMDR